jgi:Cu+-exporting ATPase
LRRGTANMDVLISLGTNASYFYSVVAVLFQRLNARNLSADYMATDFFETSAMIISFVLLGKYLESAAKVGFGTPTAAIPQRDACVAS